MEEALQQYIRLTIDAKSRERLRKSLDDLRDGDYHALLQDPSVVRILEAGKSVFSSPANGEDAGKWTAAIVSAIANEFRRLETSSDDRDQVVDFRCRLMLAAVAAIQAFLQSNATGPVLPFSPLSLLFPSHISSDVKTLRAVQQTLVTTLRRDGSGAYNLTPNIELLCLTLAIVSACSSIAAQDFLPWIRLRANFLHQRLLSEASPSLQTSIYEDLTVLDNGLQSFQADTLFPNLKVAFLLERTTIHLHHGFDKEAKADIEEATQLRHFEYALTGKLGKKTKFQTRDVSQLVVLAKSASDTSTNGTDTTKHSALQNVSGDYTSQPKAVDLNDDTLLDRIDFSVAASKDTTIQEESSLSPILAEIDPASQPQLDALDSAILLNLATSVTNTNPADGLTREETLPYASRVLEGGSSNWQVYTQALLLRSRIEGYSSRTVERGLLQLQAVVDQVIADTSTGMSEDGTSTAATATSFLAKPKDEKTAQGWQRLLYYYSLCTPLRWDLEAELASRWVSLGGLRSALDIYERLEMWPEAALCLASTDREDKAKRIIRRQLFHSSEGAAHDSETDPDTEQWTGEERIPSPGDAPRLYCILGDIDTDPTMYEKAWDVSEQRYSRAKRSLGRFYWSARRYGEASQAYRQSLQVKPIDHPTWFAYGCCLLELSDYKNAAEAFSRAVQMDDTDAESWSNLATALLHLKPEDTVDDNHRSNAVMQALSNTKLDDDEATNPSATKGADPQKHLRDSLQALRQASKHSPTNYRILSNLLTVAATLDPPSWNDMLAGQSKIIDLRSKVEGESCVDVSIMSALVKHAIDEANTNGDGTYDPNKPGLARMVVKVMDEKIIPLITASAPLWQLASTLYTFRGKPASALSSSEKAWRIVTQKPGWDISSDHKDWDAVVAATLKLVQSYETYGPMENTEGLAGGSGELVAKDWKFKARNAIRSVKGRAKGQWEGSPGWERLDEALASLKS